MDVSQPVRIMAGFAFSQESGTFRVCGKDSFERRGAAAWRFLRDIAEPGVSRHVNAALVRLNEADDSLQQGWLAGTIAAVKSHARSRGQGRAGAIENNAPAKAPGNAVDGEPGARRTE